jgi:hypothetical protein
MVEAQFRDRRRQAQRQGTLWLHNSTDIIYMAIFIYNSERFFHISQLCRIQEFTVHQKTCTVQSRSCSHLRPRSFGTDEREDRITDAGLHC